MRGKNLGKTILFKVFFRNYLQTYGLEACFFEQRILFLQILRVFPSN